MHESYPQLGAGNIRHEISMRCCWGARLADRDRYGDGRLCVRPPGGMTWADVLKNPAEMRLLARQLIEGIRNEVKRLQRNPPNLKAPSTSNEKDLFPKETIDCRTKSMTARRIFD